MDQPVYFFTSCTRGDGWAAITRLHADLEYRLRVRDGSWVSGGLSGALMAGDSWQAVAEAPCMIALCSPDYFTSRYCGMEWAAFAARINHQETISPASGARSCLLPLVWKPFGQDEVPADLRQTQFIPAEPGEGLGGEGLLHLMQANTVAAEDTYFSLVNELADRILRARQVQLVTLTARDLSLLDPAFAGSPDARTTGQIPAPRQSAPQERTAPEARLPEPSAVKVAISYAGPDQAWADWADDVLSAAGHPVRQVRWESTRHTLAETVDRAREFGDRVLVLFSRSYFEAGETQPTEWETVFTPPEAGSGGFGRWLVPFQIDGEPRPVLLRALEVVGPEGRGGPDARQLREAVLSPSPGAAARTPPRGGR